MRKLGLDKNSVYLYYIKMSEVAWNFFFAVLLGPANFLCRFLQKAAASLFSDRFTALMYQQKGKGAVTGKGSETGFF